MVIYKIENTENNKCYIGQTLDFSSRVSHHLYHLKENKHDNPYLQHAFNKNGRDCFNFEILEECSSIKELNKKEIEWIKSFNSSYNLRSGGKNDKLSEETKEKISNSITKKFGRIIHQYDLKGNYIESYPSIIKAEKQTGISHTQITGCCKKRKGYKTAGGYQWSYEKKDNIGKVSKFNDRKVKVIKKDFEGNILEKYNSIKEASNETGIIETAIGNNINGHSNTAGGFKWEKVGTP